MAWIAVAPMERGKILRVHPTALVHPAAVLADDVEIGAYCVVEPDVTVGAGCVLREHAVLRRFTTLGRGNHVDSFCALGGEPQDVKFDPHMVSYLRVGDHNTFREGVTISRATANGGATVIGNETYWMAGAHAGHDATVEDECVLVNGAVLAGHTVLGRRAILSAHVGVHQFCWVGEGVMAQGNSGISMHAPPFCMVANISRVVGLNMVGLRRWRDITEEDRRQLKQVFALTYRRGLTLTEACAELARRTDWGPAASRFCEFIGRALHAQKPHNRGLCPLRRWGVQDAAERYPGNAGSAS